MGAEQRVTEAQGAAVDLDMIAVGKQALLVWGDTAGTTQQGFADIYSAMVSLDTGKVTVPPEALLKSPGHSHSVRLASLGTGALIVWLEQKAGDTPAHLRVARYDGSSGVLAPATRIETTATQLAGLVVHCPNERRCHLLFGGQENGQAKIWGASFAPGKSAEPRPLMTLPGTPSQVPLLALDGSVAYLAAQSAEGEPQLRRLHIEWD
jgi:hypothetical protein